MILIKKGKEPHSLTEHKNSCMHLMTIAIKTISVQVFCESRGEWEKYLKMYDSVDAKNQRKEYAGIAIWYINRKLRSC